MSKDPGTIATRIIMIIVLVFTIYVISNYYFSVENVTEFCINNGYEKSFDAYSEFDNRTEIRYIKCKSESIINGELVINESKWLRYTK